MVRKSLFVVMLLIALSVIKFCSCEKNSWEPPRKSGPYLDKYPPGESPTIFFQEPFCSAPPYIPELGTQLGISFSPDDKECCYSSDYDIYYMKVEGEGWTDPVIAYFVGESGGENPMFSPDGKFFTFTRNDDIFICRYVEGIWSDAEKLPYPINTDKRESGHSITLDSVLYFTSNNRSGEITRGDIYCTNYLKNPSDTVRKISVLSTNEDEDGVYIAPDESYLIFWSWRSGGYGMHDLYISYKDSIDNWTTPQNVGEDINTDELEVLCSVSSDGKFLFFTRGNDLEDLDIYWVDAGMIEDLKPN